MTMKRRHILAAALALPALRSAHAAGTKTLRVGVQKGEPILMTAKANQEFGKHLPAGWSVEWTEFQFGPPLLEAMRAGSIDLGAVGDTPPVFAQAARADLLYLAANRGAPQSLLLPKGSSIQTIQDLKGRKIAFGRGSSAHNFALMVLEKAGLTYDQIQPVYLGPADASAAFERGAIDAWSIWEPYASLFAPRPGVRTLVTNKDIAEQFSFVMANGAFVRANGDIAERAVQALAATAEWSRAHQEDVAKIVADATGIPQPVWSRALAQDPFQVVPMDERFVASQQRVADRFRAQNLIPLSIKVSDIVWRHQA